MSRVFVYSLGAGNFIVIYADAEAVTVVGGHPSCSEALTLFFTPSIFISFSLYFDHVVKGLKSRPQVPLTPQSW